jgi:hypothetical protein
VCLLPCPACLVPACCWLLTCCICLTLDTVCMSCLVQLASGLFRTGSRLCRTCNSCAPAGTCFVHMCYLPISGPAVLLRANSCSSRMCHLATSALIVLSMPAAAVLICATCADQHVYVLPRQQMLVVVLPHAHRCPHYTVLVLSSLSVVYLCAGYQS